MKIGWILAWSWVWVTALYATSPMGPSWSGFVHVDVPVAGDLGVKDGYFGLRNARFDARLGLNSDMNARLNVDYGAGTVRIQDGYIDFGLAPGWRVRVGKFKAPIGLELLESPTDIPMIDTGYATLMVANRDTGMMAMGTVGNWDLQFAVLAGASDGASLDRDGDSDRAISLRALTRLAPNDLGGVGSVFWGVAGSVESRFGDAAVSQLSTYRVGTRPELLRYNSGVVANGGFYRIVPQVMAFMGPFGVMAEHAISRHTILGNGDTVGLTHAAWQVVTHYYLTGESASYDAVTPIHPYSPIEGGVGAVAVTGRVQQVNVDAGARAFGSGVQQSTSVTVGVNWIWRDHVKWMVNAETIWSQPWTGTSTQTQWVDLRLQIAY